MTWVSPSCITLVFRVSFTECPPKKPRSLLIWVSSSHTVTPLFWVSPGTLPRYQVHLRFGYRPQIFRLFKALRKWGRRESERHPVSSRFIFPELGDLILRKCLEYFRDTQTASNLFRLRSQMYWKASMCNNSTKANSHLIYMLNRDLIVLLKTFYHSGSPYPESLNACCAWCFFSGTIVMKPNPIVELHIFRHSYDKQIHVFPATKIWSLSSSSYAFFLFETVYYKVQKRSCSY